MINVNLSVKTIVHSANVATTTATNVMCIVSINSDYKKVRYEMDCYILHTVLIV